MTSTKGPSFTLVEEIEAKHLRRDINLSSRRQPLLVKGALDGWPAQRQWSFERLAQLRYRDGSEPTVKFQNGLVEQGATQPRPVLPVGPYLLELARAAELSQRDDTGLLSDRRRSQLARDEQFYLDWSHMQSFRPDRLYLAQWNILDEFPLLRRDLAIRSLWRGLRWTWEYVFIGPANTVTGLHCDFPSNWFCQLRGTKEVILFPPDQSPYMSVSAKYDWGATLSDIDISHLHEQPGKLLEFEKAQGMYARVEPGDALFIPKRTWHAVVALEPSISLGVFGLTLGEIIIEGGFITVKDLLHKTGCYRRESCTCHKAPVTDTALWRE